MKKIILALSISTSAFAGYGKPQMMARYGVWDHFNAEYGLNCYSSDPVALDGAVYLSCLHHSEHVLARFSSQFEILAQTKSGLFSSPKISHNLVNWYEFSEAGISKTFEYQNGDVAQFALSDLAPRFARIDSFSRITEGRYVYRVEEESRYLNFWKVGEVGRFYQKSLSYIFPLVTSTQGELVFKARYKTLQDSAPDELIYWDGEFHSLLADQDMDLKNKVQSFRHQYDVDQGQVALVIQDEQGEAMGIASKEGLKIIARAGVDLKSFEFFSPKIRSGRVAFRGVDLQGRKALYVYAQGEIKQVLTQGDTVISDKGPAQVDYRVADSIFFSSPGIDEEGHVYQQVTLSDFNTPMTLLGIALVKLPLE